MQPRKAKVIAGSERRPKVCEPFLRLRGQWLVAAGFPIGTHTIVEVQAGKLVIRPVRP